MSSAITGKRCLVTGGGTGIGRGIALRLAAQGGVVCVTGRREAPLAETVAQVAGVRVDVPTVRNDDLVVAIATFAGRQ